MNARVRGRDVVLPPGSEVPERWPTWLPTLRDLGDTLVQLARSEESIKGKRRWDLFCEALSAVMDLKTYVGDDRWRFGTTDFFPSINLQQGLESRCDFGFSPFAG